MAMSIPVILLPPMATCLPADSGYFEYARLDADCNIVATGIKATSQGARTSTEKQYLLTAPTVELLQMRLDERRAVSRQRSLRPKPLPRQRLSP